VADADDEDAGGMHTRALGCWFTMLGLKYSSLTPRDGRTGISNPCKLSLVLPGTLDDTSNYADSEPSNDVV